MWFCHNVNYYGKKELTIFFCEKKNWTFSQILDFSLKLVGTPCSYGKVPEKEEIFYEPKAKRRCDSINTEESSHSEEEDEDEERENFAEGVAKQVCGFVRYPSVLPINGKSREKTLQKLQEYGRDHCNYVRIGNSTLQKKKKNRKIG